METNSLQQEIILLTNSSLVRRQLFENDASERKQNLPDTEQLAVACWNGWLDEMLPEIIDRTDTGKGLYLWEIMQGKSFINLELCEFPQVIDVQFSINPYAVLATVCYE
jgi:hypothetical protein